MGRGFRSNREDGACSLTTLLQAMRETEGRGCKGPPEAPTTQQGTKTCGDRGQKGPDSRLECAAVVEDKVDPGELHACLPGEQLQPHGTGGPCSEPRGGREQAWDGESPSPESPSPLTMPPGESPELLQRGRGAVQLPGGQQDSLALRHLLKGTAHTSAEVWHVAHGHSQLGEAERSEQKVPPPLPPCMHAQAPAPAVTMPLTCTPGDVTETLLGRTRTWTHLLSSSAKPCGAEAPGQDPSRQHLHGVRPEPVTQLPHRALARGVMAICREGGQAAQPTVPGHSVSGDASSAREWHETEGDGGRGHKGTTGRDRHVGSPQQALTCAAAHTNHSAGPPSQGRRCSSRTARRSPPGAGSPGDSCISTRPAPTLPPTTARRGPTCFSLRR